MSLSIRPIAYIWAWLEDAEIHVASPRRPFRIARSTPWLCIDCSMTWVDEPQRRGYTNEILGVSSIGTSQTK